MSHHHDLQELYEGSMRIMLDSALPKYIADNVVWAPFVRDIEPEVRARYEQLLARLQHRSKEKQR